jgi:carboxypeptidase family protein
MLTVKTVGKLAICVVALPFVASRDARAQGTVLNAIVADAETGVYILDAEVTVDPVGLKGITDYFGDARFPGLRKGRYTVRARRLGFAPLSAEVELSGRDSLDVTLLMASTTHNLADVTIDANAPSPFLREFEERRRQGKGQYITDSVLRASLGSPLEDILTARLRGVMVSRGLDGSFTPYSARGVNKSSGSPCFISVYWNGVRITNWSVHSVDMPTAFIGGIEFYNPGSIPAQYQDPGSDCGVMLLWPRP